MSESWYCKSCDEIHQEGQTCAKNPHNLDWATELAMRTNYAHDAVDNGDNPINSVDAGAFFLEGFVYATNSQELLTVNILRQWPRSKIVGFAEHLLGELKGGVL